MQPNLKRVLRALAREGLDVARAGQIYTVKLMGNEDTPVAEVLLPDDLPLEGKAFKQLANLAAVRHPHGGHVRHCCATPDFHPGDSGIAIGSVVETDGMVIPQAVGDDINCGMRLHMVDLTLDKFMSKKDQFVALLKGDYLLGTRDVAMSYDAMWAMFQDGLPLWAHTVKQNPLGFLRKADMSLVFMESETKVQYQGWAVGNPYLAPEALRPLEGVVRDDGLGTIGRGNHFVEVQVVNEIKDPKLAYAWGVRRGQIVIMIHSGSRQVGKYIGTNMAEKARKSWPKEMKYPSSGIFPVSATQSDLYREYLNSEATAANYGFVNRAILAELARVRLREVYGDIEAPLVWDAPHNLSVFEEDENGHRYWVCRKGACPAHYGQPVIIPGSMGTASYLLVGKGNHRYLRSASHGAGRAVSRGSMGRFVRDAAHARELGLTGVECITLRDARRVEEAPAAYKPIEPVIRSQVEAGIVSEVAVLKPILTFKA